MLKSFYRGSRLYAFTEIDGEERGEHQAKAMVRPPGFEPGFPAVSFLEWEAGVIDQAARHTSISEIEVLALDHGRQPNPADPWFVSIFARSP